MWVFPDELPLWSAIMGEWTWERWLLRFTYHNEAYWYEFNLRDDPYAMCIHSLRHQRHFGLVNWILGCKINGSAPNPPNIGTIKDDRIYGRFQCLRICGEGDVIHICERLLVTIWLDPIISAETHIFARLVHHINKSRSHSQLPVTKLP